MNYIAYLDCFAGVSGDMLLGALLDLGWPRESLQAVVGSLSLSGVTVQMERVSKHSLSGIHIEVEWEAEQPLRHPADITAIISQAALSDSIKERAIQVVNRLAEAEARVHGIPLEEVHFHEVGAIDTLVDIVGAVAGLEALGVGRIVSAPLPWSHGLIQAAHGMIPLPGPAVTALLEGADVRGVDLDGELVTPTGAALVTTLADSYGSLPAGIVRKVGYGAGSRDWDDRPNLLRVALVESQSDTQVEELGILACNLDDMNPEWLPPVMTHLLDAGALDVWMTPIQMKKGRPGVKLEVLAAPSQLAALRDILFKHTTTLGIREQLIARYALKREFRTVDTPYGPVQVKGALVNDDIRWIPEHEDCQKLAMEHNVSIQQVWLAACQAVIA